LQLLRRGLEWPSIDRTSTAETRHPYGPRVSDERPWGRDGPGRLDAQHASETRLSRVTPNLALLLFCSFALLLFCSFALSLFLFRSLFQSHIIDTRRKPPQPHPTATSRTYLHRAFAATVQAAP